MVVGRIHHVAVICSDYERSKAFYVGVLGLKVIREIWRAERKSWKCDLAVDEGSQIELFTFPGALARASYPEALGLRHLAFEVGDVDGAVRELQAKGVAGVEEIRLDSTTGKRFVFLADPDGLPIELYER